MIYKNVDLKVYCLKYYKMGSIKNFLRKNDTTTLKHESELNNKNLSLVHEHV